MPNITLDLKELLEVLWKSKPAFTCPPAFAKAIKDIDPTDIFCHVEYETGDGKFAAVWRLADWRTEYENYLRGKAQSDIRVAAFNQKKEILEKIGTALVYLGLDATMTANMARKLYEQGNTEGIKHLTGLEYKKEELI